MFSTGRSGRPHLPIKNSILRVNFGWKNIMEKYENRRSHTHYYAMVKAILCRFGWHVLLCTEMTAEINHGFIYWEISTGREMPSKVWQQKIKYLFHVVDFLLRVGWIISYAASKPVAKKKPTKISYFSCPACGPVGLIFFHFAKHECGVSRPTALRLSIHSAAEWCYCWFHTLSCKLHAKSPKVARSNYLHRRSVVTEHGCIYCLYCLFHPQGAAEPHW